MAISFVGSTAGGAVNGGNVTLTLPGTFKPGDVAYVTATLGTSRTTSPTVRSSSGGTSSTNFTELITSVNSSYCRFSVFRLSITSTATQTQAVVIGTANSTDATAGAVLILRGAENSSPEDVTSTSTTGASANADSPSITVVSCSDAIISAIGIQFVSIPTAPSSFLNAATANANDTIDATAGIAWITNATTAAFNPTAWTSTSASWCSATVAVRPSIDYAGFFAAGPDTASAVDREKFVTIVSY